MITLTDWLTLIKSALKHPLSKKELRSIILEECLFGPRKNASTPYDVNGNAVWDNIIAKEPICLKRAEAMKIKNAIDAESFIESRKHYPCGFTY